jgi:hypothetical protein
MDNKINTELLEKIKDILNSEPLDVLVSNEDVVEGTVELVNSRYIPDSMLLQDRYIGTANLLLATTLYIYASLGYKEIVELEDSVLDKKLEEWHNILDMLRAQKFIRDTELLAKEKIKLIVDNTKSPYGT